ncbi:MAG: shikimate dehydrogenase [Deltaproteobacteria bacterium]|nr:shikimate dehydrogenase [Deltaproteobacteria bacterium]MBW2413455.1 shikimate dehydrogenase [Deltaproteobacteria bacterium]
MTTRCGIVLHPAGHTLSPVLHEAAYVELGLDASFEVWDVRSDAFASRVAELREQGVRQLAVSLPHKESAVALADEVSDAVVAIGAANTLTLTGDGALRADNTDWIGVRATLEAAGPWQGARAVVVGAGGAARAALYALGQLGIEVSIVNRTPARAERLAADLGARVGTLDEPWDLLVQTTPVGMEPESDATAVPADRLRPGATVLDAVYRPLETRLLREAKARGCRALDGLDWLVHQAAEQVRLWSGREPTAAALRGAAEAALRAAAKS